MKRAICLGLVCAVSAVATADEAVLQDATLLYDASEYRDAVPLLQAVANDAAETVPDRARAFLYLALCQAALGDTEAASGYFQRAFRFDPAAAWPANGPAGARALADEARARLGLPALAAAGPPPAQQPTPELVPPLAPLPPVPPPSSSAGETSSDIGSLGAAQAALDRLSAEVETLRQQGAPQEKIDEAADMVTLLRRQVALLQAAAAQQANQQASQPATTVLTPTPPPAKNPDEGNRWFIGVDALDVGFIGTAQASPTLEWQVGLGDNGTTLWSFLFGAMLGQKTGYDFKIRSAILGTQANPVGWNWSLDAGFIDVPAAGDSYFEVSSSPINITWKVSRQILLEARVIGVGYYVALQSNVLSTWTLEGGLAARWRL